MLRGIWRQDTKSLANIEQSVLCTHLIEGDNLFQASISFLIYGAIGALVGMGAGAIARSQESRCTFRALEMVCLL